MFSISINFQFQIKQLLTLLVLAAAVLCITSCLDPGASCASSKWRNTSETDEKGLCSEDCMMWPSVRAGTGLGYPQSKFWKHTTYGITQNPPWGWLQPHSFRSGPEWRLACCVPGIWLSVSDLSMRNLKLLHLPFAIAPKCQWKANWTNWPLLYSSFTLL